MGSSGQEEEAPGIFRAWVEGASGNMALALTALVEQVQSWAKGVGLGGLLTLLPKMDTLGTLLVGWMVFVTLILMLGTFFYFKFIHTLGNETSSEQDDIGPGEGGQGKATKGKGGTGASGSATAGKSKAAKKDEVARKPTIVPDHKPEPVSAPVGTGADPDAVKWTNNVFTWLYNSADGGQLVRKVWLETLNENTVKTAIDTGILVEVVELMKQTPAPVLSNMVVDCSPTDNVTITCDCDATLYLRIITTRTQGDQTTESEYACAVTPLRGRLNLAAVTAELLAVAKFDGWPEVSLKLEGIRNNSTGLNEQQMLDVIDEVLTSALRNSVLEFNFQPTLTFPRFRRARQAPDPIIPVGYDSMVRERQTHPPSAPRKTPKAEFVPLHDEKLEAAGESFTALTFSSNLTSSEEQLIARNLTKYPSLENAEMGPDEIEEFCKTWQENYVPAADVPPPKEEVPEPPPPATMSSITVATHHEEEGEPKTQNFVLMVSSRSKLIDEPRNAMVVEEEMDGMEEEEAELADVMPPRRPSDEPCLRKETGSPLLLAAPKYNNLAEPEEDDLEDTKMRFDRLDILEKPQLGGSAGLGPLLKGPFVSEACCVGVQVGVAAQVPQLDLRLETAALDGSVACDLPEYDQEAPTQPPLLPPLHNQPSSATTLCLESGVDVDLSSGSEEPSSSPSPIHSLSPESLLPTASGVSNLVDGSSGENDVEERELLVSVGEGDTSSSHQSSGVVVCAELGIDSSPDRNHSEAVSENEDENSNRIVTLQDLDVEYLEEDLGFDSLPDKDLKAAISKCKAENSHSEVTLQDQDRECPFGKEELGTDNLPNKDSEALSKNKDQNLCSGVTMQDQYVEYLSEEEDLGIYSLPEGKDPKDILESKDQSFCSGVSVQDRYVGYLYEEDEGIASLNLGEVMAKYEQIEKDIALGDDLSHGLKTDGGNVPETQVHESDNEEGGKEISVTRNEDKEKSKDMNTVMKEEHDGDDEISIEARDDDDYENEDMSTTVKDEGVNGKTNEEAEESDEDESEEISITPKEDDDYDDDDEVSITLKEEDEDKTRETSTLMGDEDVGEEAEPTRDDTNKDTHITTTEEKETEKEKDGEPKQGKICLNNDEEDEDERERAHIVPKRDDTDKDIHITTTAEKETEKEEIDESNEGKICVTDNEDMSEEGNTASEEKDTGKDILITINTRKETDEENELERSKICLNNDGEDEEESEKADIAPKETKTDKDIQTTTTTTTTTTARSDTEIRGTGPAKEEEDEEESKQNKMCLNEFTESLFRHIEIEDSELSIPEECVEILPWEVMDVYVPQQERQHDPETSPKASGKKGSIESDDNPMKLESPSSPSSSLPEHEKESSESDDNSTKSDSQSPPELSLSSLPEHEKESGDSDDELENTESPSSPLEHEKESSYSDNDSPSASASLPEHDKGSRYSDGDIKNLVSPSTPQESSPSAPLQEDEPPPPTPSEEPRSSPFTPQDSLSSPPLQEQHSPSLSPYGKVTDGEGLEELDEEVPSSSLQEQEQHSSSLSPSGKVTDEGLDEEPQPEDFMAGGEHEPEEQRDTTQPNMQDRGAENYICSEENDNFVSDYFHEQQGKDSCEMAQESDPPPRQEEEEDTQDIYIEDKPKDLQLDIQDAYCGGEKPQNLEEDIQDIYSEERKPKNPEEDIQDIYSEGKPEDLEDLDEGYHAAGREASDNISLMYGHSEPSSVILDENGNGVGVMMEAEGDIVAITVPDLEEEESECIDVVTDKAEHEENGKIVVTEIEDNKKSNGISTEAESNDDTTDLGLDSNIIISKAEHDKTVIPKTEVPNEKISIGFDRDANIVSIEFDKDSNVGSTKVEVPYNHSNGSSIRTELNGDGVSTKTDPYKDINIGNTEVEVPDKDNSGISTEAVSNGMTTNLNKDIETVSTKKEAHGEESNVMSPETELGAVQSKIDTEENSNNPMEAGFDKDSDKSNNNTQLKDTNMIASETDALVQANGRAGAEETQNSSHTPDTQTLPDEEPDEDVLDNARITELRRQHQLGAFIPSDSEVEMRTSVSSLESLNAQLQEALKNKYYASLRYPAYFSGEESTTDANTDDEYFDPRTLARDPFSPEEKDFKLSGRDDDEDELGYSSHGTYSAQDSSTDSEVEEIIGGSSEAGTGGLYSKAEWRMSDISLIAEAETIDDGSFESRENQATPTPLQDSCIRSSHETVKYATNDTTSDVAPTSTLYKVVNASQEGGPASHQDSRQPSTLSDGGKSHKHTVGNSSRESGQEKRVSFGGVIVESEDTQTQQQSGTSSRHSDSGRKGKLSDATGQGEQGNTLTTSPQSVAPLIPTDNTGALTQPQVASRTGELASGGAAVPDHTPSTSGLPQWTKPLSSYPVYGTYFVTTTSHSTTSQPMGIPGLNGKRLLVKIVKATGVGCEKPVSEAYSVVEMDEPPQKFTTSVVKDTSSPFWDEQFLFDLSGGTLELLFELYDKTNGNFLGLGIVGIEELVATPSQRQIIPLQSRPYENDEVSGSLTVEFLFLDRADLPDHTLRASTTSQSVTPRGDLVTTTTTTYIKAPENQDVVVNGGDSVAAVVLRDIEEKKAVVTNNASKSTMIIHASKKPDYDEQHGYMTDELLNLMTATTTTATPTITTTGAHTTVTTSTTTATQSAPVTTTADTSEPAENDERGRSRGNRRKRDSFFGTLKKRFSRSKVRSKSMDPGQRDPSLERDPSIGRSVSMERSSALNRASGLLSVPPGAGGDAGSTRSSLSDASAISSSSTRTYVNEASTLIVETSENGVFKHYLIPLSLQQKSKWRKKGLKLHIFGEHTFVAKHMSSSTPCEVCQKNLGRRFGKQGYMCRDCGYKCHKPCHVKTETTCPKSTVNNMDLEYVRDPKEERRAWLKKTNKTA